MSYKNCRAPKNEGNLKLDIQKTPGSDYGNWKKEARVWWSHRGEEGGRGFKAEEPSKSDAAHAFELRNVEEDEVNEK